LYFVFCLWFLFHNNACSRFKTVESGHQLLSLKSFESRTGVEAEVSVRPL
jgi:hypothetical protein